MSLHSQFITEDLDTLRNILHAPEKYSKQIDKDADEWLSSVKYFDNVVEPAFQAEVQNGTFSLTLDDNGEMYQQFGRYQGLCHDLLANKGLKDNDVRNLSQHLRGLLHDASTRFTAKETDHVLKAIFFDMTRTLKEAHYLHEEQNSLKEEGSEDPEIAMQLADSQEDLFNLANAKDWWTANQEQVRSGGGQGALEDPHNRNAFMVIYDSTKSYMETLQADTAIKLDPKGKGKSTEVKEEMPDLTDHENPEIAQFAQDFASLSTLLQNLSTAKTPDPDKGFISGSIFLTIMEDIISTKVLKGGNEEIEEFIGWSETYADAIVSKRLLQLYNGNKNDFIEEHKDNLALWSAAIATTIENVRNGAKSRASWDSLNTVQGLIEFHYAICFEDVLEDVQEENTVKHRLSDDEDTLPRTLKVEGSKGGVGFDSAEDRSES